jgi:predicted Fe-Mo cluster-binding NifX family protein
MKIAFSTSGNDLNGDIDPRFGRAAGFLVYDTDTKKYETVNNDQNLNAMQGAGIQSAQLVAGLKVEAVVTGHCGPKAFRTLSAAGVRVYNVHNTGLKTVSEALKAVVNGEIQAATGADVDGHW